MIDGRYFLEFADPLRDRAALDAVRVPVFIDEQQVPVEIEWDDDDLRCDHALVRDLARTPIATGRLSPEGKIGRMAVLKSWRGQGVGAVVLRALIERARERGMREVHLHAQVHAEAFYAAAGFRAFGERFDEAGIEHVAMSRVIAAPEILKPPRPAASDPADAFAIDATAQIGPIYRLIAADARRELRLLTHDLERAVLDDSETLDALKAFCLDYRPRNWLKILVRDPTAAIRSGHRLVALAQRLSSVVSIRVPTAEDLNDSAAYLVNEGGGYLLREVAARPYGRGHRHDGVEAARLRRQFDQVWERATEHPDLRRLGL
jgi:predicted GNAT family N-acyltransferase